MLLTLRLTDFGVLEEAEVTFGPGLTVLTGETGAGKSMLLGALSLLLGGRAEGEVIRAGAEEAVVEGVLERTDAMRERLDALGLPDLGPEVVIRRVVPRSGRARVHVNGALTAVGVLARLMHGQVELAGQHEHMALLEPSAHLPLIDRAGKVSVAELRAEWARLQELETQLQALGGDDAQFAAQADFLEFQIDEIEKVGPRAGEDLELEVVRKRLAAAERLKSAAAEVEDALCARESSATELLGHCIGQLVDAERSDPSVGTIRERLVGLQCELDEAVRAVTRYASGIEADPNRLHEVEDRLEALKRLCKKHAAPLEAVVAKKGELEAKLTELRSRGERRASLEAERNAQRNRVSAAAGPLSQARKKAAKLVEQAVRERLARLSIGKGVFEARVSPAELGPHGADAVELWFSANPGEPARPLQKVASGGEASRLMLALRSALADDDACTCVFDEADAGVGGAVADAVGRLLREVSERRQVLCVTHLPQVAAHADQHLHIEKGTSRGRTRSVVNALADVAARERELARMLSGVEISQQAVGAAQALLQAARRAPRRSRSRAA
ncbi:MAG: DNA repair protein RecN [Archangiaceae bacterium]|nr:DNA repair protein RecN [Archangiaceae bacterium]